MHETQARRSQEPVPIPINPDPEQEHRYASVELFSTTSTKRQLICQAKNPDGTVESAQSFTVKSE